MSDNAFGDSVTGPARRRDLRRDATDAERQLWKLLRNRQLAGAKVRRQHDLGPYILDFYCPALHLAIEADGGQHTLAGDAARTRYLEDRGIRVLRFTNVEILTETASVLQAILHAVEEPSP